MKTIIVKTEYDLVTKKVTCNCNLDIKGNITEAKIQFTKSELDNKADELKKPQWDFETLFILVKEEVLGEVEFLK